MKQLVKIGYIIFSIFFIVYLSLPSYSFPEPPQGVLQSNEPADTETFYRRAYFTNLTREEVMEYYERQIKLSSFLDLQLPTYRLNYPPEEAKQIIRDQTRSTFLEEIVHPSRESVYVNGFEPIDPKDKVIIQDKVWRQKIIIKQVNSQFIVRLSLGLLIVILIPIVFINLFAVFNDVKGKLSKLWIYR